MTVPGAAVEIVRSDRDAHEFLEQIELFVGAAAGNQSAEGLGAMRQLDPFGLFCHIFQGLFPGGFGQRTVPSDQGLGDPAGMARGVESKKPAGAEVAVVPAGPLGAVHFDQFLALGLDRDLAAVSAK